MASQRRGAFIVLEGLDRSGKSTQAAALVSRLKTINGENSAKLMKFPDRTTTIGKMIDAYLRSQNELDDHTIHLLFSANRWELVSAINADLAAGITIVCDRYAFSGCAFSAAKGLPYDWCIAPDKGLPEPDLTVFLDLTPAVAKLRGGYGEERYEKEELQRKVRVLFHSIGKQMKGGKWQEIDASSSIEEVEKAIWKHVEPFSDGCTSSINGLWIE
ncbi:thymidylate kinase [Sistotremastrum niveocremeum HHB9708]|uniref:Thymidylate kinase n=2 Tax=Sistotremastraceae TaxID=3402574 RepID=A0A164VWC1_9AGAM|nr:thymidylate kinase [Sistotremastrum niveocremeum HHB9708]KZT43193.1 thymidylate kinase [Sistotremastrum suecicum HHB10207 ss-3]